MTVSGNKELIFYSIKTLLFLFGFLFLQSCGTEKYLMPEESLVTKNLVEILDPENVIDPGELKLQLATFIEVNPNNNFLGVFPREGFYFRNSKRDEDGTWRNFIDKNIAQKPSFYNEDASARSAEAMQLFMRNLKGYYKAEVSFSNKIKDRNSKVKYIVNSGKRYHIDSVGYVGFDKEIINLIEEIQDESFVKKGDPVDVNFFEQEKNRLVTHLQNIGYANFKANRLKIYGDSSNLNNTIDVFFEVLPNPDGSTYKKYSVGEINVYGDYYQGQDLSNSTKVALDSIWYHRLSKDFVVKPKKLAKFISITPGEFFDESDRVKTFKKLNSLDVYKFSNIKPIVNPDNDSILDFDILLTPQNAKWISDFGLETFYSTISNVQSQQQLLGASAFVAFENRNMFGGAERNRINIEFGADFNLGTNLGLATSTIRIQDNLEIPTFIDVFKSGALIHKLGVLTDEEYFDFKREATSDITIGYSGQKITNFYDIISFNASIDYNYIKNSNHRFSLRQLALNLNSYRLSQAFKDQINNNQFILKSLDDNLLTGFLFRDFNYSYNSRKSLRGNSYAFIGNVEFSGWEIALANSLGNAISNRNDIWELFGQYKFSKYYRVELDGRFYHEFSKSKSFASRLNFAIARPFYDATQIPFIKQFYVGGPSDIRAWQIRELGPGSYEQPPTYGQSNALFFQQGDLKLLFSTEYRFDIFPWLESALFFDGGNVWSLDNSDERIGSQFSSKFLNDIALGYGWGIRFDLSYFIIRFDFGYKLRRPFTNDSKARWISITDQSLIGNINVAINYPF